ncbi:MAG TPA: Gfo/Idh/MocA family oxidoreductase [Caldilineaceae bacterium]|nr:Gfo/Idh/MocA family oxidoreductase [Caldilineaceae bacterium]
MILKEPLNIALIGTGFRSRTVYRLLFPALHERGVRLVAVCDPVRESADSFAASLNVPAFYSVRDLVRARPMEAALVCTPVELFHAISCYLSAQGIHHLVEAGFCASLAQARSMIATATANNVTLAVGEQFFRLAYERFAKRVADTGVIGPVNRIISTFSHTGTHNNACWIKFFDTHPDSAQAVSHTMPTAPHRSLAHRLHTDESFHANFFTFPGAAPDATPQARFVADMTSNAKAVLGRHARPGHIQYEGSRGTIVVRAAGFWNGPYHQAEGEVRYCSDRALETNGIADIVYPIIFSQENEFLRKLHVDLPTGRVEYLNPFYHPVDSAVDAIDYYHAATAELIVEFAQTVRGETTLEYSMDDAYMVQMMNAAARESLVHHGVKLALPLAEELESQAQLHAALKAKTGVDPLDVEGMLDYAAPRA